MKMERVEISGFGKLRDVSIDLSDKSSIILFYGRNEAGKSTMMQFIRAMLFGFPSRSQLSQRYEPEAGGAHGGALTIRAMDGRVIRLERYNTTDASGKRPSAGVPVITLADGTRGGEELLPLIIGDLTPELFRQLFAFGLDELQEIRSLHSDEISAYLFSTGYGLSGSAVMEAEKRLKGEMDQLFKPRGRKQSMNKLADELEQIDKQLRIHQSHVDTYHELTMQMAALDEELSSLERNLQEAEKEMTWHDQLRQARSPWQMLRAAELELKGLPEFASFPEDAVRRYEDERKRIEDLSHKQRLLSEQLAKIKQRLAQCIPNEQRLSKLDELEALQEQAAVIRSLGEEKRAAEDDLTRLQTQIDTQLVEIHAGWSEQDVMQLSASLEERADISGFREKLQSLARKIEQQEAERDRLQREHKRFAERAAETAEQLGEAERHLQMIGTEEWRNLQPRDRRSHMQRIRKACEQWRASLLEVTLAERRKQDEQKRHRWIKRLLMSFLSLNVALPTILLVIEEPLLALVSGGLLALMNIALFVIWHRVVQASELPLVAATKVRHISEEVQDLLDRALTRPTESDAAAAQEARHLSRWARGSQWTLEQADALAEQLEHTLEQLQSAEEHVRHWKHRHKDAQEQLTELTALLKEQEERLAAIRREQQIAEEQWRTWLRERHFPVRLQPETAGDLLSRCEQIKQLIRQRDDLQERINGYARRMQEFERQVQQLAAALDEPIHRDETAFETLRKLTELARTDAAQAEERSNLTVQYEERNMEWAELSERIQQAKARIQALFEEAGAADEAHFRQRAAQYERSRELKQTIHDATSQLEWLVTSAELDRLMKVLTNTAGAELEQQRTELAKRIETMKQEIAKQREIRGKLLRDLEELKEGDEHAALLQRKQEKLAELQKQASQYIVRALASNLLARTRQLYERERQPKVLQAASRYLHSITGGRYIRILAPFGEQRLIVERADGRQLDPSYLSRGTTEQLYLAMRFALIEAYTASRPAGQASLPLIMDDILVNFDEERAARCLDVIGEIGTARQVLMFTCHDYVRELVKKQLPSSSLIVLEQGEREASERQRH